MKRKSSESLSPGGLWRDYRRMLRIWRQRMPELLAATVLEALAGSLAPYVTIYFSARLIDEIAGRRNPDALLRLTVAVLAATGLVQLLAASLARWKKALQSPAYYAEETVYIEKYMQMDFSCMDDAHTRDLYAGIMQNRNWNMWGLLQGPLQLEKLVKALAKTGGAAALSVTLFTAQVPAPAGRLTALNHPVFLLLILALLLLFSVVPPLLTTKANRYWAEYSAHARLGNRLFSFFGFIAKAEPERAPDIRIYRQDRIMHRRMKEMNQFGSRSLIAGISRGVRGICLGAAAAVSRTFTGLIYLFVCLKAWGGAFGIGMVTQYVSAVTALSDGLATLFNTLGEIYSNGPFLRKSFEFLDLSNEMYQGSLTVEKRSDRRYEIEFRNVSFRYPSAKEWALENVSFKFYVGERLAVVGENGSGKTTMIKLLCRLYDPTEGEILLNGIDIRKYSWQEYMNLFSVVFQDFQLVSFPLGQNVAGRMEYDRERASACLENAGFHDRLMKMPKGLDTCLYRDFDPEGVEVSGGEAQKIAIARALYKDAPFIVLDEPTAALDPVAEAEIYADFDRLIEDKTAVYISHRLSSCRFCDRIAVFDHGRLLQSGSHEELVKDEDGKYYSLWAAQAQYYT